MGGKQSTTVKKIHIWCICILCTIEILTSCISGGVIASICIFSRVSTVIRYARVHIALFILWVMLSCYNPLVGLPLIKLSSSKLTAHFDTTIEKGVRVERLFHWREDSAIDKFATLKSSYFSVAFFVEQGPFLAQLQSLTKIYSNILSV